MDLGELRPTIKSAIMFEEMTGKNFFSQLTEEDELIYMYCVFCTSVEKVSYKAFLSMLDDRKFVRRLDTQWQHYARFMEQFKHKVESNEAFEGEKGEISMESVAGALIFKFRLDPGYVLDKAELWELDFLLKAGNGAYQERMETDRLWTFLTIVPHLDSKKSKNMTPSKLFPFPWEETVNTKEGRQKVLEKESGRMKKTIGMHLNI